MSENDMFEIPRKRLETMTSEIIRLTVENKQLQAELEHARTTLTIVQEREIKLALVLGRVYLGLSRLAAEPPNYGTGEIIEMMTTIEAVVPGDGNNEQRF